MRGSASARRSSSSSRRRSARAAPWAGIATLRYDDVRETVHRLRSTALELGARILFESFPNCILGDPSAVNLGRSTFGETHYLDDATGDRIYSMRHIEGGPLGVRGGVPALLRPAPLPGRVAAVRQTVRRRRARPVHAGHTRH
jgi:hypothetical protein